MVACKKRLFDGAKKNINLFLLRVRLAKVVKEDVLLRESRKDLEQEVRSIRRQSKVPVRLFDKFYSRLLKGFQKGDSWRKGFDSPLFRRIVSGTLAVLIIAGLATNYFNAKVKASPVTRSFEQQIQMVNGNVSVSSGGAYTDKYSEPALNASTEFSSYFNYNAASWSDAKLYFEVVMSSSSGTAYASLFNVTTGVQVAASEVTTASSTGVRVRSSEITSSLTNGQDYKVELKGSVSITAARIIIVQSSASGTITATESQNEIGGLGYIPDSSWAHFNDLYGLYNPTTHYRSYYYDSSKFDGTVSTYFEVTGINYWSSYTASFELVDETGTAVSNSQITIGSSTPGPTCTLQPCQAKRARIAVTLASGHTYSIMDIVNNSYGYLKSAKIVVDQTGTITKVETVRTVQNPVTNNGPYDYTAQNNQSYWDPNNWQTGSTTIYTEADGYLYDGYSAGFTLSVRSTANGTPIANTAITFHNTLARGRSPAWSAAPAVATTIDTQLQAVSSGSYQVYVDCVVLIVDLNLTVSSIDSISITGNSANVCTGGQSCNIGWTSTGPIDHFSLKYSLDANKNILNIADNVSAAGGSYSWTVPYIISSNTATIRMIGYDSGGSQIVMADSSNFQINVGTGPKNIVQTVPIFNGSYSGTPTSYTGTSAAIINFNPSNFPGGVVYLEAVMSTSSAGSPAHLSLSDSTMSSTYAATEISTAATSLTTVRSAPLSLSGDYSIMVKCAATMTLTSARLVIIQSGQTIAGTETAFELASAGSFRAGLTAFTDPVPTSKNYLYDSSKYDGTISIYLEATFEVTNPGYSRSDVYKLYDKTANTEIASVSSSSMSWVRVRSDAITNMVSGHDYEIRGANPLYSANPEYYNSVRLIIDQTGFAKFETVMPVDQSVKTTTSGTYVAEGNQTVYEPAFWQGANVKYFAEASISSAGGSGSLQFMANGTTITNSTVSTSSSSINRVISTDISAYMPTGTSAVIIDSSIKEGSSTFTVNGSWIVCQVSLGINLAGTVTGLSSGQNISVSINGNTKQTVQTTSGGAFLFNQVNIQANSIAVVYVDNGTQFASLITQAADDSTSLNLTLIQNDIIIRYETAGPMTNTLLSGFSGYADSARALFSVSGTAVTFADNSTAYIPNGLTYQPGGTVSFYSLSIPGTGSFSPSSNAVTVRGSWSVNSGSTFSSSGTITFNDTTSTTIDTGGKSFNNLTHSGVGTLQLSSTLTVTGNFANQAGTVDANSNSLKIAGNFTGGGSFGTTGTVEFTKTSGTQTINSVDNSKSLPNLLHSGAGTLQLINNNLPVGGNLTNSAGTLDSNSLNILLGGNWSDSGTFIAGSGTLALNGTIAQTVTAGSSSFYNINVINSATDGVSLVTSSTMTITNTLSASVPTKKIVFTSGKTYSVKNFNIAGGSISNLIALAPSSTTSWILTNGSGTRTFSYVSVSRSDASALSSPLSAPLSSDLGNNLNWSFVSSVVATVPASAQVNHPISITVNLLDGTGAHVSSVLADVTITSSDSSAHVSPSTIPKNSFTNGTITINIAIDKVTSTTLTFGELTIFSTGSSIQITPGDIDHFTTTYSPPSIVVQTNFPSFTIVAYDQYGNTKTDFTGSVYFTSNDSAVNFPVNISSQYTFTGLDAGSHQFLAGVGNYFKFMTPGAAQTFVIHSGAISITLFTTLVTPAALDHLTLTGAPASTVAGANFSNPVVVTAYDQYNNVKTNYTGTITFQAPNDSFSPNLPSAYAYQSGDLGQKSFPGTGFTLKQTGSSLLKAIDSDTSIHADTTVTVTPAAISQYTVANLATTATAGTALPDFTVTAKDQFGNTKTDYTGNVWFTFVPSDDSSNLPNSGTPYTFTTGSGHDNGIHTFSGMTLYKAQTETLTLTDGNDGRNVTCSQITVSPATFSKFSITGPSSTSAGSLFSLTVTAQDQYSNTRTDYTGVVHFTTLDDDSRVVLPNTYTYTTGSGHDNGVHQFDNFKLIKTSASQTISAIDTPHSVTASYNLAVTPAAGLSTFTVLNLSSTVQAGTSFTGGITAEAIDTFGNIKTDYTGDVWFTSSDTDSNVLLPASSAHKYTFSSGDNGVHLFTGASPLKLIKTGSGSQTVTATNGTVSSPNYSILITPAALDHFQLSGQPSQINANVAFSGVTATAYDQYSNLKTDYTGSVQFETPTDSQSVIPYTLASKYTFTTGNGHDNGVHLFGEDFTLKTKGDQILKVIDTLSGNKIGQATITVSAGAIGSFTYSGTLPNSIIAGNAFASPQNDITITALDVCGNVKDDFTGVVWFESSDPGSSISLPASQSQKYTYLSNENGVHKFLGSAFTLITTSKTGQTITLSSNQTGVAPLSLPSVIVIAAPFDHFGLEDYPDAGSNQWATAGADWSQTSMGGDQASYDVTVSALDRFGNINPDFSGKVWFSMGGGINYSFANDAEFPYTFNSNGGDARTTQADTVDNGKHIFGGGAFTVTTAGSNLDFKVNCDNDTVNTFHVKVKPGAAASLAISFSTPFSPISSGNNLMQMSGDPLTSSVTVTALDISNNVKTDYTGSIYFASTDASATLPYTQSSQYTFADLDQGSKTFTSANSSHYFTFRTGGNQTLIAYGDDQNLITPGQINGTSAVITVSAQPPINVEATAGHQQVTLSWLNQDSPSITGVNIYQSQSAGTLGTQIGNATISPGNYSQFTATGLTNGLTYYYSLKSVVQNQSGNSLESVSSAQVSATPADLAARNVTAIQLSDGRVKVQYFLRYASSVSIQYHNLDTAAWVDASSDAQSGDVGLNQAGDANLVLHTAYWLAKGDYPNKYYDSTRGFQIRVKVILNNTSAVTSSSSFALDTQAPFSTSVLINAISTNLAELSIAASDNHGSTISMMISNNPAFTGASWQNLAASVPNWDITGASEVYVKFMDSFSNQSEVDSPILSGIENFSLKDVSDLRTPAFQLFLSWKPLDDSNYQTYIVERTDSDGNFHEITRTKQPAYTDLNLTDKSSYAYQIKYLDNAGNISRPSNTLSAQPGLAPSITAKPSIQIFGYKEQVGVKVIVSWVTDQQSDSFVAFSTDKLQSNQSTDTETGVKADIYGQLDRTLEHEVTITSLLPGKTYYMKSLSQNDIKITGYSDVFEINTPAYTPLQINSLSFSDLRPDSVWVTWQTNKLSTTKLLYGLGDQFDRIMTDDKQNTNHTFKLENLTPGVNYKLKIEATDQDGNGVASDIYSFNPPPNASVSNITFKNVTNNSANISWNTNVNADSNVEYGTDANYGFSSSKSDLTTLHDITLTGLASKATYHFKVTSKDNFGKVAESNDISFTTLYDTTPPKIDDISSQLSQVSTPQGPKYQSVISWKTDEGSTSQIEFGDNAIGQYTKNTQQDESLNITHVVILSDLKSNSAYSYRVVSKDASGNEAKSQNYVIITPPQDQSIVQLVVNTLTDTFSWASKLRQKWFK